MMKSIKIETAASRAVLIAAGVFCLAAAIFSAKWCFADAMAARAPDLAVAELSAALAPSDPQTHYAVAVLSEKTFSAATIEKSTTEFGRAAALAPHDYRLWLAYGKALERAGNRVAAEAALEKALQFAPNYAVVRWTYGNVLIRRGKTAEGFAEIRRAAASDPNYRLPLISSAWQIYEGDLLAVERAVGDSVDLTSVLAVFLAKQNRLDEAFEIWNRLPADQRTVYRTDGEQIYQALLAAKRYRKAVELLNDAAEKPNPAERFAVGKIYNGGFETELAREKASFFDWQIADGLQPQIGPNEEQKRGGNRSVFIVFNSTDGKDFRQIRQTVAVEAGRKYVFGGFYKSNLKAGATVRWEIADAESGAVLATANPIAANADWTNFTVPFAAPENAEAVVLRLVRERCGSLICPISGNVWFDDFSLAH